MVARSLQEMVIMQNLTTTEREKHIKSVFHGLELEGFKIDTEERELAQMYIEGKISLVDFKTIRFKQLGVNTK